MHENNPDWELVEGEGNEEQRRAIMLQTRLKVIAGALEKEAEDRVAKRYLVETRWIADLQQFHGRYDDKTLRNLGNKSKLFINETRPKTNAMEARLTDMLLPTDDRNFGMGPTPVPEMSAKAEDLAIRAAKAKQHAVENPQNQFLQQQADELSQATTELEAIMDEARKRAKAMEEEIADHLKECSYEAQLREVIRDSCRLGTGVMKGPVIGGTSRRSWVQTQDGFAMEEKSDTKPVFWRVDPWSFFPDMDATSMDECEGVFERHLMNPKQLRRLSRQPGFAENADAFRRLLRDKPRNATPVYISDLRSITGSYLDVTMDRYHVWEYHGPLASEDMRDVAEALGKDSMLEALGLDEDVDPLIELEVTIWFSQGEILKFGIHHLDSQESIYSVFNLEKDEASIFGFGVPYLMRDAQKALCSAWRMMMDNSGLSTGPQIEVDQSVVEPANGEWDLEPRKIWLRKQSANPNARAFNTYNIESHQAELANIVEMCKQFIDDETGIPVIAQGEQGAHVTQTAHGMNILMNASNIVFRRIVKNFDDDMTVPNIRRMYDYLMQFSSKEYIKGDFEVDARGSSVLLVREMQSANLLAFLMQFGGHPVFGRYLKEEGLPALRKLVQTMMISADEVIKTDDEILQEEAAMAEQPQEPNPEILKIEAQMNLAEMERQTKMELAQFERETEMIKLAHTSNIDIEKLRSMLQIKKTETDSKERIMAAEVAVEQRMAAQGIAGGSGGYVSAGGDQR